MPTAPTLHWLALDACASTNDVAAQQAESLAPGHYLAVTAQRQTAGRGQSGRRWTMPEGAGIAFSVATRLPPQTNLEGLSLAVGAALAERLELLDLPVRLKWPNDLLVAERKLGGILVEAQWRGQAPPIVVVGVGLNHRAAPRLDDRDPWTLPPTALAEHLTLVPPAETLLQTLVGAVVAVLEDFRCGAGFTPWQAAWWARAAWRDRWLQLLPAHETTEPHLVRLSGVNARGELQVTTAAGAHQTLTSAAARIRPVPLLLDLGNSRGKWYWRDDAQGAFAYDDTALEAWWQQLTPLLSTIPCVVGVSVTTPSRTQAITARFAAHRIPCHWIVPSQHGAGVLNQYRNPQQLGADRWVTAVGAWHAGLAPAVIVGCGTATTLDWLDETGAFRGGAILPGIDAMFAALAARTARLPQLDPRRAVDQIATAPFPPTDTETAIATGVWLAQKGAIAAFTAQVAKQTSILPRVILHGGAAPLLSPHVDIPHEVRDNLLFLGLAALACAQPESHPPQTPPEPPTGPSTPSTHNEETS